MKHILVLGLSLLLSSLAFAQKDVTKFMGIPVDGTKQAMIQKLKAKGFTYNTSCDCMKGQFNGSDSRIYVVTNGNKVYRIRVAVGREVNESDIKINYNNLARQFEKNNKYLSETYSSQTIDDDVDISYEMTVNNKRFQAAYYQVTDADMDTTGSFQYMLERILKEYGIEKWESMSDEEHDNIGKKFGLDWYENKFKHRLVWFMISEFYGKYQINIFYDNVLNQANGEDL